MSSVPHHITSHRVHHSNSSSHHETSTSLHQYKLYHFVQVNSEPRTNNGPLNQIPPSNNPNQEPLHLPTPKPNNSPQHISRHRDSISLITNPGTPTLRSLRGSAQHRRSPTRLPTIKHKHVQTPRRDPTNQALRPPLQPPKLPNRSRGMGTRRNVRLCIFFSFLVNKLQPGHHARQGTRQPRSARRYLLHESGGVDQCQSFQRRYYCAISYVAYGVGFCCYPGGRRGGE